jgi:glutathione synthase
MKFLFVMDPIEHVLPDKDTTFVFMLESQKRGHEIFYTLVDDLYARAGKPRARVWDVSVRRPTEDDSKHGTIGAHSEVDLDSFDAIFMRKDPPFDMRFFYSTHILSLVEPAKCLVLNKPSGLRDANEKLYALHFPSVIPETLVTCDMARIKQFVGEMGGDAIIKPLDGAGGAGIFHLRLDDRNLNSILEYATDEGRRTIMAQRYLPEVRVGDKRLIVLDGEPLGAVLRVPRHDDTRSNIHVGGSVTKVNVTDRDREIVAALAPRLKQDGLYFVGLDIIGDWLTEVNVTSPTGVQEINTLDGVCLEANVIDFVERRVEAL